MSDGKIRKVSRKSQAVLYDPTSQDEDLDTYDPEVDWDDVDWHYATDDDDDFIATDDDLDSASGDSDDGWSSESDSAAPCCASHLEVKPEPENVPHDGAPRSARGTIRPLRSLNESEGTWPEATLSEMPATPLLASATARVP